MKLNGEDQKALAEKVETGTNSKLKLRNKYIFSNIAIAVGIMIALSAGLPEGGSGDNGPAGVSIIFGALAYRSVKKRKLGLIKNQKLFLALEIIALLIVFIPHVLSLIGGNFVDIMKNYPVSFAGIPVWILIAYFYIASKKKIGPWINKSEST